MGTVRERARWVRAPLPAATLWGTGRSARPALPATYAGAHQPRPTPQLAHQTVLRYYSAFRAVEPELGDWEGQVSAHRAGSSRQANGQSSVKMYAPYFGRVGEMFTALG